MNIYKNKINYIVLLFSFIVLIVSGCSDDTPVVTGPTTSGNTGTANFAMYVSIGNSLTAGFQSNALSQRDQVWSFPSQIANQVANLSLAKQNANAPFEQPLIKNPGLPGRLRLQNLPSNIVVEPPVAASISSNLNATLARPYNNLGVPGAKLNEIITPFNPANGFFGLILRDPNLLGNTVIKQARNLQATFVTAWIGSNDVLGYATTGGGWSLPTPFLPTSVSDFSNQYKKMLDSLTVETRGVIVGNIPDVSSIPFFSTVGPILANSIPWSSAPFGLVYSSHNKQTTLPNFGTLPVGLADSSSLKNLTTFITLAGKSFTSLLGQPTGLFYRNLAASTGFPLSTILSFFPSLDTTQAFGFDPRNPFPDVYVLDPDEIAIAKTAVDAFNGIITAEAGNRNIAVVDFNAFLKNVLNNPITVAGIGTFTSSFITGGLFSYDGVHPTSRGYGIIANEWIKVINQEFNATIPPVDLNSLPSQPIGKIGLTKFPDYPAGFYNDMIRMITGDRNWPLSNR